MDFYLNEVFSVSSGETHSKPPPFFKGVRINAGFEII